MQATTTDLSSFGVRTLDASVDEDLLLPGFEYHFMDEPVSPPVEDGEPIMDLPDQDSTPSEGA